MDTRQAANVARAETRSKESKSMVMDGEPGRLPLGSGGWEAFKRRAKLAGLRDRNDAKV